jgi:transposase
MLSMYNFEKIRALIKAGHNDSEISRKLGIHRHTIAKYRQANAPPRYSSRSASTREDPVRAFDGQISEWLKLHPDVCAQSIFALLQESGYRGSLRTIERRVSEMKSQKPKERYFEQQYEPGEQCQLDFKESVEIPFLSGLVECQLFLGTLPYSDVYFAKAFPNKAYEAFMDGLHSFFEVIGGMTENIRFDNLSPVVKKVLRGSERIYTAAFERARGYYDFGLLPCAPGKGSDKGDCERDIRTFSRRLQDRIKLLDLRFKDHHDFNLWLLDFCLSQRSESNSQRFALEAEKLKPLPPRDETILCQVVVTAVGKYGVVRVSRKGFSVPDTEILRQVKVVTSAFDVKIYRLGPGSRLIATHPRISENESSILLEHSIGSLLRKPHAMIRWAHRHILFPAPVFERYYDYLKRILGYGAESEFLKSVNLVQHADLSEVIAGIELILESKSQSPFYDLKSLVTSGGHYPQIDSGVLAECQPPLNLELSDYDRLIPA